MKKLRASSLLEVLVAGVLLCIIVSISLVTFLNITFSSPSFRNHQLDLLLQARMNSIRTQTLITWEKSDTVAGGVLFEKVTHVPNNTSLFMIDLEIIDTSGKVEARATALHYQYDEQIP